MHYQRWRKHGDPNEVKPYVWQIQTAAPAAAPKERINDACAVSTCCRSAVARGWCDFHHSRWKKHGDPLYEERAERLSCVVEGCPREAYVRGLCRRHKEWDDAGKPLLPLPPLRPCSIEGCVHDVRARGWCTQHYHAWQNHGDPLGGRGSYVGKDCEIEGCWRPAAAKRLCLVHWDHLKRFGDPLAGTFRHHSPDGRCIVARCEKKIRARALCTSHYNMTLNYSLDVNRLVAMYEEQEFRCAICGKEQQDGDRSSLLVMDHDHSCCNEGGRSCGDCVRGLICNSCNGGLGFFSDDIERMRNAARYVESWRERNAAA